MWVSKLRKILVIEDNENIRIEVSEFFKQNCFNVISPKVFTDIDKLAEAADIVLLDINLNELNGFDICKSIRRLCNVPVLFVTGRSSEEDELKAMELGGDDYVRKPYSLPVILAKVNRMLQRNSTESPEGLKAGDAVLNIVMGQLSIGKQTLELSKNEVKILYYLFINKSGVVDKDELIEYLWDNKLYVDENILNVNISRLRRRLAHIGYKEFIETVPKKGYRLRGVR